MAKQTPQEGAKVKKRTGLKIFCAVLCVLLVLVAIFGIRAAVHSQTLEGYGEYLFETGKAFDTDMFPSVTLEEGATELKIMQIADPQIKFGAFPKRDRDTFALLETAIKSQQPDLCVVTGDLTCSIFTYDAYKYFADFMEKMDVKWALVYGNHDAQFDTSKYTIWKMLKQYDNCLFMAGPSNIYGESNYIVNIFRGEKTDANLAYSLVMLDSGEYPQDLDVGLTEWVYDWIHQSQMDWYTWAIKGLQGVKADIQSSAFFHIPIKEFANMYYINKQNKGEDIPEAVKQTLPNVSVHGVVGTVCESDKSADECVYGDDGYTVGIFYQGNAEGVTDHPDVFSYIKDLGSTKAVFCGHDHANTLKGWYDGVFLGYGLCSGYHTYPFFNKPNFLTNLLGVSDKVLYNGQLWVDEDSNVLEKGVTMITISLADDTYGEISVVDKGLSVLQAELAQQG